MDTTSPDYQSMLQMWLDFAAKVAPLDVAASDAVSNDGANRMRDMYLQTLNQYTEQYMRSPPFLKMMKQSTDTAIKFRQESNDFLAQAHHAVGSLARPDVDSLLMAIRRCETRVLDKLDEVSAKMNELESRCSALESNHRKPSRKSR